MIIPVDDRNIEDAAYIHSESWKESHRDICTPEFIEIHTPERQKEYIGRQQNDGRKFYMLIEDEPLGIVSIKESLIENLYVLPDEQGKSHGSELLEFAVSRCNGTPTLWIISTNTKALRFYRSHGFRPTGKEIRRSSSMTEMELSL